MVLRVAAAWALIGFALQCFRGFADGSPFDAAIIRALTHYFWWGLAGFFVGWVARRVVDQALRNTAQAKEAAEKQEYDRALQIILHPAKNQGG